MMNPIHVLEQLSTIDEKLCTNDDALLFSNNPFGNAYS